MIVVFDCESTGTNRATDQIIELHAQLGLDATLAASRTWRIKPGVPIQPDAQKVHGITAEMLANCSAFADVADEIREQLSAATVLVGYNVRFDLDLVQAELQRAGRQPLDLGAVMLVDPLRLWQSCEPRTLAAAHERFVGSGFDGAHQARADVAATARVLEGMLHTFGLDPSDWVEIAAKADPLPERRTWLGPSNHVQWRNGLAVFGFGKNNGMPVAADPGFLQWLLSKDFPLHVKEIARAALTKRQVEFLVWCRERYPEPVRAEADGAAP